MLRFGEPFYCLDVGALPEKWELTPLGARRCEGSTGSHERDLGHGAGQKPYHGEMLPSFHPCQHVKGGDITGSKKMRSNDERVGVWRRQDSTSPSERSFPIRLAPLWSFSKRAFAQRGPNALEPGGHFLLELTLQSAADNRVRVRFNG
jgi:hypothetical protein